MAKEMDESVTELKGQTSKFSERANNNVFSYRVKTLEDGGAVMFIWRHLAADC